MTDILTERRLALGVTGSIAAYKALTIVSRLAQAGAEVDVLLTRSAAELVQPLAFQALTHRPVTTTLFNPTGAMALDHISIARSAEILIVAPATADIIARLALGRADDALTTTALACRAPLLIAPAMEPRMWSHPATQAHVGTLQSRGAVFVGPLPGRMASGESGLGRMAEPEAILDHVRLVLSRSGGLAGRSVVVSAGPTREPIDPVRYLGNRSSGRMGYAIARAMRDRGADVMLVSGPTALRAPAGVRILAVETASEMCDAVLEHGPLADAVIMTAAVADYRPAEQHERKVKKTGDSLQLTLVPNADVLLELDRILDDMQLAPLRVGFAAETDNLVSHAEDKLRRKHLDLIIANPVPETFGSDQVTATLVDSRGAERLEPMPKAELADLIVDRVTEALSLRDQAAPSPA
jgi:phosphopantothenoylcysteine decarboxylase/phosphopantothenate--cysteine ligase